MTAKIPEIAAFGQTAAKHLRETHGAAVCLADVQSANVVGYATKGVLKDDYTMFGIQFEGVGGDGVKFKDLGINATGGTGLVDADNILLWKDGEYHYYYFGDWGDEAVLKLGSFSSNGTELSQKHIGFSVNFYAAAVPEPTSAMLLLLGVAGLALRRRRA